MTVRIAQISDTHLSPTRTVFDANFDRVAEHLRDLAPDLVVNTGDLSMDGADHAPDLALARDRHRSLGLDCRVLPGNHDVGDHPDVPSRQPADADRLARWRATFGDDCWTLDLPGWRLLAISSLTYGTGLPGDAEQRETVRRVARDLAGRSLAVLMHKPLADERYDETLRINRFTTAAPRAAFLADLGATVPALVLCGHVHQYRDTVIAGTRHVWAPAVSFMISDPWQPVYGAKTVGYLEHRFHADGGWDHRLVAVRGLAHHDLLNVPEAYGDVRDWGPGNA
jgi:Icc protein